MTDGREDAGAGWAPSARLKAVLTGLVGLIGAITGLIQIEEWITNGLRAVVRLTLITLFCLFVVLLYRAKSGRQKYVFAAAVVSTLGLLATVAVTQASGDPTQRSRAAWAEDVNRICGKYVAQMGRDYDTIRLAGVKIVERSQQLQKYTGDTTEGIRDYLEDLEVPIKDAFPAITRTDSNYRTIQSEIARLRWPTRTSDETLARGWWNLYQERTRKFADVYIAAGSYLVNNSPAVRPTTLGQFATAVVAFQKISEDFYSKAESLGIEQCR